MVATYISFQNTMTFSRRFFDKNKVSLTKKIYKMPDIATALSLLYSALFTLRQFTFIIKVAEHSFQEPIPNSPLLFSYLCFGAHFLQG